MTDEMNDTGASPEVNGSEGEAPAAAPVAPVDGGDAPTTDGGDTPADKEAETPAE